MIEYYVYEGNITNIQGERTNYTLKFSTSNIRLPKLKEEMKRNEFKIDYESLKLLYTTNSQEEASKMASMV